MSAPAISRFPVPSLERDARRYPHENSRGAGKIRLRAERVPGAGAPARRIPRLLCLPRRADGEGRRTHQGRARDDRGRDLGLNQCQYCVVAHGAILRIRAKNPLVADQVAINYRKADITPRQKAMLDFAVKVSGSAHTGHRTRISPRCAATASATRTSGTSPRSQRSSRCRTAWRMSPTCGRTTSSTCSGACRRRNWTSVIYGPQSSAAAPHQPGR